MDGWLPSQISPTLKYAVNPIQESLLPVITRVDLLFEVKNGQTYTTHMYEFIHVLGIDQDQACSARF